MWIITHIDPTRTVRTHTHTDSRAHLEGKGYRQFIYTGHSPHCPLDTHIWILVKKRNGMSQFMWKPLGYTSGLCLWFGSVSFAHSHKAHIKIGYTTHTHTHTHMMSIRLPSKFHANFWNAIKNLMQIKWFSIICDENEHQSLKTCFRNLLALGKLLLSFGVS